MAREHTYRCEGPMCNTWIESTDDAPVRGWILLTELGENGKPVTYDYCSWNCVMMGAASVEPPEDIKKG